MQRTDAGPFELPTGHNHTNLCYLDTMLPHFCCKSLPSGLQLLAMCTPNIRHQNMLFTRQLEVYGRCAQPSQHTMEHKYRSSKHRIRLSDRSFRLLRSQHPCPVGTGQSQKTMPKAPTSTVRSSASWNTAICMDTLSTACRYDLNGFETTRAVLRPTLFYTCSNLIFGAENWLLSFLHGH